MSTSIRLGQDFPDAGFDRSVFVHIQFYSLDAELLQGLGSVAILGLHAAHRGADGVAGARQGFGRVAAKAAARACDEDCLGHGQPSSKETHAITSSTNALAVIAELVARGEMPIRNRSDSSRL
jgi:hypothetical protein